MPNQVLVVDDELIILKTCSLLLPRYGYQPALASCGEMAVSLAEKKDFDLVLCDMRMPGMDGGQTIKRIRDVCHLRHTRMPVFITMTGDYRPCVYKQIQGISPAAMLRKPFGADELMDCLCSVLCPGEIDGCWTSRPA